MSRDDAVAAAREHVKRLGLGALSIAGVRHWTLEEIDRMAVNCPREMIEIYNRFRQSFRDQWVVSFSLPSDPGETSSPSTLLVRVYENGEVSDFPAM